MYFSISPVFERISQTLSDYYPNNKEISNIAKYLTMLKLEDFASEILLNFDNREEIYGYVNFETILSKVIPHTSKIIEKLNPNAISVNQPILEILRKTRFGNTFIQITLEQLRIGLLILNSIVIYSIILKTVHGKIYEIAVQRVLGLNKLNMIELFVINAFLQSILGLVIGLPLTKLIFIITNETFFKGKYFQQIDMKQEVYYWGLVRSIFIALSTPLLASILPIKDLLGKSITTSLDKDRSKTVSIQVKLNNNSNAKKYFDKPKFFVALCSITIGVSIYFLVPYSMLTMEINMFILVFFSLLSGVMIGVLMIFINFSYLFEKIFQKLLFFEKQYIVDMVKMNLISHRIKNRRTILIIAMGLCFINFIYVITIMHVNTSNDRHYIKEGGDIVIKPQDSFTNIIILPNLLPLFTNFSKKNFTISTLRFMLEYLQISHMFEYSYVTNSFEDYMSSLDQGINELRVINVGRLYLPGSDGISKTLMAVSPNHMKLIDNSYTFINTYNSNNCSLSVIENQYSDNGVGTVITSESIRKLMSVNTDMNDTFQVTYEDRNRRYGQELSISAGLTSMPGFRFSDRFDKIYGPYIMSLPTMFAMVEGSVKPWDNISLEKIVQSVKKGYEDKIDQTISNIESFSKYMPLKIWVKNKQEKNSDKIMKILSLVTKLVTFLSLSLSLFSLVITMNSNMFEQMKEIAIMRSMGMDYKKIGLIFMYECVIIIMNGGVIALCTGCSIAWLIVEQNGLWNEVNRKGFIIPWELFITVTIFAIISSIFSALMPARKFFSKNISELIRGSYSN